MEEYFDYSGIGEGHDRREPPQRSRKAPVGEFFTWAIRAVIVAICSLAYTEIREAEATLKAMEAEIGATQITIAKMSMQQDFQSKQLDEHARQLDGLWKEIRDGRRQAQQQ